MTTAPERPVKTKTSEVLGNIGSKISDAEHVLRTRVEREKALLFDFIPNILTTETLRKILRGEDTYSAEDINAIFSISISDNSSLGV